jgi:hypothetical protein
MELLANKLVESNPDLLKTARLDLTKLYNTVLAQEEPCLVQKDLSASKAVESNSDLSKTARLNTAMLYEYSSERA